MSDTLLIIGAGLEQVPAYKLAKQRGYTVVGTDMDPEAPALQLADHRLIASTRNVEETCQAVADFAADSPIDGVMTIANDVPYTVARVAELLGLPGASPAAVKKLTDKVQMKSAFLAAGIATPGFLPVTKRSDLEEAANKFEYPYILKPSDGRGSKGVLLVDRDTDEAWAFDHAMSFCANGKLIAEKFYSGRQLSVEGMFVEGRYIAVAFADRNYDNLSQTKPFIVEDGGTIPSSIDGDLEGKIQRVIEAGAKALGLDWGTVKADIVLDDSGRPAIIELAGRLSGNYLATHHIPFAYGVDIVACVMDVSLGRPVQPDRLTPTRKQYLGVRYFFPPAGKIHSITGAEEVAKLPYVHEILVYPKAGDVQPEISHHGARAGTVMAEGASYEEATERAIDAAGRIKFDIRQQPDRA